MDKQKLSQLRYLSKEIELLKRQIEAAERDTKEFEAHDVVEGSNLEWPYQRKTFHIEGISMLEYEKKLKRLKRKLQRRIDELMDMRDELEEYIATIQDSELRMIFTLRYINGLSWQQIAAHMGVAGDGSTERKKHDRFLNFSRNS